MLTVKHKDSCQIWVHDVPDVQAVKIEDEMLDRPKPTREINIGNIRITMFQADDVLAFAKKPFSCFYRMFQADDVLGKDYEEFCDELEAKNGTELSPPAL